MSFSDPTKAFDDPDSGGGDDDGSSFFDDDVDYSTDLEEEEQLAGGDTSTTRDDDDDDDDDTVIRDDNGEEDVDSGGISAPPGVSGPLDEGPTPGPGTPQEGELSEGETVSVPSAGTGGDDDDRTTAGDRSGDLSGDITETAVRGSSLEAVRLAAEEQFPEAEGFNIRQTAGVGDRIRFEVEANLGDRTEQRTVFVDEGEVRTGLREEEERLERETGRDIQIVDRGGGTRAEFASDEERRINQEDRRDARADLIEDVLQQVEAQVGRQRAERQGFGDQFVAPADAAGTSAGGRRLDDRLAAQFADLERGEDVILDIDESEGSISVDARLSDAFAEEETRQAAAAAIERETGAPIDPDRDISIDPATGRASLSEEGEAAVATQPLTDLVRGIEELTGIESPIEGPILERIDRDRDLGERDIEIPIFGDRETVPGPRAGARERVGTTTFDEELAAFEDSIIEATSDQGPAIKELEPRRGRAGAAIRTEDRSFTGEFRTPVAQASESAIRGTPLAATGTVGLAKDIAEFEAEVLEAVVEGDAERIGELERGAKEAGTEAAVLAAANIADDPGEFAARGTGSIIGSIPVFGGAAAIGPRASLAARGLIQPGEEIAGIGGFRATRAIAGERRAQQFFPNQEPLIFSEEAALRNIRRAAGRFSRGAAAARSRASTEAISARFRAAEINPRSDVDARPLTENIRQRLAQERKALEFRRAEIDPRQEAKTPDTGILRFVEEGDPAALGAIPRTEVRTETETIDEFDSQVPEGFATEQETRQQVEQPELDAESGGSTGRRRIESTLNEGDILSEVEARAIAAQASKLRQRVGTRLDQEVDQELDLAFESELETEQESETELEAELESELEQELIQEVEAEAEQELEIEAETEPEPEFEAEVESDTDPFKFEEELLAEIDPFGEKRFESGIADVEAARNIEERILGNEGESSGGDRSIEDVESEILDNV